MNKTFSNQDGAAILLQMVRKIQDNKAYLGDVDGLIGDGDHGMNMNKGFTVFETRYGKDAFSLSDGLSNLSMVLMNEIGGSMGPIYGTIFLEMSDCIAAQHLEDIDTAGLHTILDAGLNGLYGIVDARVGDKTLVDTLAPAVESLKTDAAAGVELADALDHMTEAARRGRDSTKELVAKYGRSSRLGERSRGVLDAGACSCCLLLEAMAEGIRGLL